MRSCCHCSRRAPDPSLIRSATDSVRSATLGIDGRAAGGEVLRTWDIAHWGGTPYPGMGEFPRRACPRMQTTWMQPMEATPATVRGRRYLGGTYGGGGGGGRGRFEGRGAGGGFGGGCGG